MEEAPMLKLRVEKGPRQGETLECKPQSTIRIGRVVRGNNFTIRDSGISSKHLLIEFKDPKWLLLDLDTSNGTVLNETQIEGMEPLGLRDGDVIEIGEFTSIRVSFGGGGEEEVDQLRRNPRRGAVGRGSTRVVTSSKSAKPDLVSDFVVQSVSEIEGVEEQENAGGIAVNRLRRATRKAQKVLSVDEKSNLEVEEGVRSLAVNRPRRAATKLQSLEVFDTEKVGIVGESSNLGKKESRGEEVNVGSVAVNRPRRGGTRATRSTKVEVHEDLESHKDVDDVAPVQQKRTRRVALKRGRNSEDEHVVSEVATLPRIYEPSDLNQESCQEPQNAGFVEEESKEVVGKASECHRVLVSEAHAVPGTSNLQKETCDESNFNMNPDNANAGNGTNSIDLEKMTLADWFDYLEVYLPKHIHERSDEIVSRMRERAKKFNEFMVEQQDWGKSPVP